MTSRYGRRYRGVADSAPSASDIAPQKVVHDASDVEAYLILAVETEIWHDYRLCLPPVAP